jgi:hypothetical protein
MLCGLTVGSGGVRVDQAVHARIDSVRVSGSAGVGVEIAPGSSVSIVSSEVRDSSSHGIAAIDAANGTRVDLDRTLIVGSGESGIWMQCDAGCDCGASIPLPEGDTAPSAASLTATATLVQRNRIVGVSLEGVGATLDNVEIVDTRLGDIVSYGQYGGGLNISGCSRVAATRLGLRRNASFGVLVDDSSASLGGEEPEAGVEIVQNVMGLWMKDISRSSAQAVVLDNGLIQDNRGVGLGISGNSRGFVICRSTVTGTATEPVPVGVGDRKEVGDGVNWLDGSVGMLEDVELSNNARASLLIDGSVPHIDGSLRQGIVNLRLTGGDELKGILQQGCKLEDGCQSPQTGSTPITSERSKVFEVALPPDFSTSL